MARIRLSEHFTYGKLLRFVMPSIMMMIFTSIYSVVDGLFVSNFVGKTPFAAINLIAPVTMVLSAFGFMAGTGGTAIIGKTLGEKKTEEANRYFSLIIYTVMIGSVVLAAAGLLVLGPLAAALGATGSLLDNSLLYGRVTFLALPFFMLQVTFQSFFAAAEKPTLGLGVTVISGVTNIVMDALFIIVFEWGLYGAAFATALSQVAGAVIPVVYFALPNDSLLRLTAKTKCYPAILWKMCTNGSSEMVSNLASSLIGLLYNYQLMRLLGENGVAAYGILMYVGFIFAAVNFGYVMGFAPAVCCLYGAGNDRELGNLFRKSILLMSAAVIVMFLTARLLARPMAVIFVSYDVELLELTVYAFHIFAFEFLTNGLNTFASAFFTALNDGKVSAILAVVRTFLCKTVSILWLPVVWGVDGIWGATAVAEAVSLLVTIFFLVRKRKKYHYA